MVMYRPHMQRGNDVPILTEAVSRFLPPYSNCNNLSKYFAEGTARGVWMYMEVAAVVMPQKRILTY